MTKRLGIKAIDTRDFPDQTNRKGTDTPKKQLFILMGMKHCGKTSLGKRLATSLQWTFFDTDEYLVLLANLSGINQAVSPGENSRIGQTGKNSISYRDIYETYGKQAFQELELKAVQEIITRIQPDESVIMALGGGMIDNTRAMALLQKEGLLIYLDDELGALYKRIVADGLPPFLHPATAYEDFKVLYKQRTKKYSKAADRIVSLRGKNLEEAQPIIEKVIRNIK